MNKTQVKFIIHLVMLSSCISGLSQVIQLPRINGEVDLDGYSDESAWEEIQPVDLTMYMPEYQGDPTEKTEIRIAYDDNYFYFSGRFYDSDPNGIQGNSLIRDRNMGGDFAILMIDANNDDQTSFLFMTQPSGNRVDGLITNYGLGASLDWNGYWSNGVVQDETGWFVEMRIPLSTLSFESKNGNATFGVIAHRLINRKRERLTYPNISPEMPNAEWRPQLAQDVQLTGIDSKKPMYVTPYIRSEFNQKNELDDTQTAHDQHTKTKAYVGLDIRYRPSTNLNLALTINTDFAQAEADALQVNLTRFPLFFPEKRQFFLERASVFDFKTGGISNLFYSRRIGMENGIPRDIYGGLRGVYNKNNEWDIGVLSLQAAELDNVPTENFSVVRVKKRKSNSQTYLGGIFTNRISASGNFNTAFGADAVIAMTKTHMLELGYAQTFGNDISSKIKDNSLARAAILNNKFEKFGYDFEVRRSGTDYNPDMGFIQWRGYLINENNVGYGWLPAKSAIRTSQVYLSNNNYWKNDDFLEAMDHTLGIKIVTKSGHEINVGATRNFLDIRESFNISDDTNVPAGAYNYYNGSLNFNMSRAKRLRFNLGLNAGEFYDGKINSLSISPIWNISKHVELGGDFIMNNIAFDSRSQKLNSNIERLRVVGALNSKVSLMAFLQYNNLTEMIVSNVRFRYNPKEGTDLYIVYNELMNTNRHSSDLVAPLSLQKSIVIKFSYTFIRQ